MKWKRFSSTLRLEPRSVGVSEEEGVGGGKKIEFQARFEHTTFEKREHLN
jgi:hypothetical protein